MTDSFKLFFIHFSQLRRCSNEEVDPFGRYRGSLRYYGG